MPEAKLTTGDRVSVWPHGSPAQAAVGRIVILSENQCSVGLAFDDRMPWLRAADGIAFHPELGLIMLASREELGGVPWGPWVDIVTGGHFEIEPAQGPGA